MATPHGGSGPLAGAFFHSPVGRKCQPMSQAPITGLWSRLNDRREAPKHKARRIVIAQEMKVFLIFLIFTTIASSGVYESAGAATAEHHRLGALRDRET